MADVTDTRHSHKTKDTGHDIGLDIGLDIGHWK